MNKKCDEKLLETVAFSNRCVCSAELIQEEHTHFHPSGNLTPSKHDTMMTDRMAKMCELMGIPLLDHVIVGGENLQYFSFKEKKLMDTPKVFLETNYQSLDLSSGLVAEQGKAR